MNRYPDKRDAVEKGLLEIASRLGAQWYRAPPLDGWIHFRGKWLPVEIKDPTREGLGTEYTPLQLKFFSWCRLNNAKWLVWRNITDLLADLNGGT